MPELPRSDPRKPMRYIDRVYAKLSAREHAAIRENIEELVAKRMEEERAKLSGAIGDMFIMASLLVLIDDFGFGTTGQKNKESRLAKYIHRVLTVAGEYSSTYEDGLLIAMKKHLHERGLDYEGLEKEGK